MKIETTFAEKDAQRIWNQYVRRIERILRPLPQDMREEISLEIQGHLLESMRDGKGHTEIERLLDAVERLGEPEEYLKPLMADRLLAAGIRTLHPATVAKGLFYSLFGGVGRALLSIIIGIGFLLSLALAVVSLLKPVFPRNIGMLWMRDGEFVLGVTVNASHVTSDPLGYWFIPLGFAAAIILYLLSAQLSRVLRRSPASFFR